jgi:hypothetical protein
MECEKFKHCNWIVSQTYLIGLGNVGKKDVDHRNKHSVFVGVTSVLNNGDNVGSLFGDFDQLTARTVRELYSIDGTLLC